MLEDVKCRVDVHVFKVRRLLREAKVLRVSTYVPKVFKKKKRLLITSSIRRMSARDRLAVAVVRFCGNHSRQKYGGGSNKSSLKVGQTHLFILSYFAWVTHIIETDISRSQFRELVQ